MAKKRHKSAAASLLEAIEAGAPDRLQKLIEAGADVNEFEGETTPLCKAAELGRADLVKVLLKAGANPDAGGVWVPLCRAVASENVEVVQLLLAAKAKVDGQEEDGISALMLAAAAGNLAMVKLLVAAGASPNLCDEDGESAIIKARESRLVVEFLTPLCPDKDVEAATKRLKQIAPKTKGLLEAARTGNARRVLSLLAEGAPVDGKGPEGETALHLAVAACHTNIVETLLRAGAEIDAKNRDGRTPLFQAVSSRNLPMAERLLAAGADVDAREELAGLTPFLAAVGQGKDCHDVMRLLARHGADIKTVDKYGRNAVSIADRFLGPYPEEAQRRDGEALRAVFVELGLLDLSAGSLMVDAARRGDVQKIKELLAQGASPSAEDPVTKELPLLAAASAGQAEAVRRLIEAGAPVNSPSNENMPVLLLVADAVLVKSREETLSPFDSDRYVATVRALVEAGAQADVEFLGLKPLEFAREAGCRSLVDLLEDAIRRERESR